jgi:hypothetical protein
MNDLVSHQLNNNKFFLSEFIYMNFENDSEESFSWINHISENLVGLLLFILAIVIIGIVEYISRFNALYFPITSPIPGIAPSSPVNTSKNLKKKRK